MAHRKKWLIVFLVQNVVDVEEDTEFMESTMAELLELKADDSFAVAGCISTTVVTQSLAVELDAVIQGKGRVFNFVVELRIGASKEDKRLHVLDQLPSGTGLDDPGAVTKIFQTIHNHFEYEHLVITTLDHGAGYSIFEEPGGPQEAVLSAASPGVKLSERPLHFLSHLVKSGKLAKAKPQKKSLTGKGINPVVSLMRHSAKHAMPSGITVDQLREAIRATFGKADVIFMRNCFMQMFDTGCTLCDVTSFLVTFESLMWFPAYNYVTWLRAMQASGDSLTSEQVARFAIRGLTKTKMPKVFRDDTALFGNDLSYYPAINDCMNVMIRELIDYVKGHKGKLMECRRKVINIAARRNPHARYQLVDAQLWFEKAGKLLSTNEEYQKALERFLVLKVKSIDRRRFVGKKDSQPGYRESGFSLYFPTTLADIGMFGSFYSLYYSAESRTLSRFTRFSLWPDFIAFLFLDIKPCLLKE
jgi:hypothetical protein